MRSTTSAAQHARAADAHAGGDQHQGFPGHDRHDRRTTRAKRHAHAELPGSALNPIGEQAIQPSGRQHQRDRREAAHQQHQQPRRRHAAGVHLVERAHAVKRDLRVHARGNLPKRRDQRLERQVRSDDDRRAPGHLAERHVVDRVRRQRNRRLTRVADDADDLTHRRALVVRAGRPGLDALAERRLSRKELVGKRLVDDQHARVAMVVEVGEVPSSQQRRANRREISRRDDGHVRCRSASRRCRTALDCEGDPDLVSG